MCCKIKKLARENDSSKWEELRELKSLWRQHRPRDPSPCKSDATTLSLEHEDDNDLEGLEEDDDESAEQDGDDNADPEDDNQSEEEEEDPEDDNESAEQDGDHVAIGDGCADDGYGLCEAAEAHGETTHASEAEKDADGTSSESLLVVRAPASRGRWSKSALLGVGGPLATTDDADARVFLKRVPHKVEIVVDAGDVGNADDKLEAECLQMLQLLLATERQPHPSLRNPRNLQNCPGTLMFQISLPGNNR